ncbi:GMC family oxidoreductase N-terminal domain-containing protein [Brucella sp. NBRC 12950]|uniref:GMC family oxidoreductase n=1 Tax=Brucella sp. NBRC 12950 TaxID=2994518 RepID=UPI0024A02E59|nr:GMC family oxidoreductase N-terminal domain-containing protein [Brucella sp. NBRC 12950]GLU29836.1 alanine-phosphoribitol ligase [Brucella sp. NBRC 12950]
MQTKEFDYIVVGGGSAGCAVAGRLSENPENRVALIEEGPSDWHPYIHLPVTVYKTAQGDLLQRFLQQPSPNSSRETHSMVQARVLGGGSSVNAMLYVRGIPDDYDNWQNLGADGWSYKDVLPYFTKSEHNDRLANDEHGQGGPLGVSDPAFIHPLSRAWLKACQQAGLPYNADFNSGDQLGCGFYQTTTRDGRRCSSAVAFVHPARRRPNFGLFTQSRVTRLIIEKGRAKGVEVLRNGERHALYAQREVVVSAGAINSPRLLMLSGIGPADQLRSVGIDVVHDLPGVGQNLQDHMDVYLTYHMNGPNSYDRYKRIGWKSLAALEYGLFKRGPVTSNIMEAGAFWWGDPTQPTPDIQYVFLPGSGVEEGAPLSGGYGCTLNACLTRPRSRGYVSLRSADPTVAPVIAPNYFSHPYDLESMGEAVRFGCEIMSQNALQGLVGKSHLPDKTLRTRSEFLEYARRYAQGALHPAGTCRIGAETDRGSVLDPELRVRGILGLRVADASVMPSLTSGNTNAPSIMIGERAAAFLSRQN